MKLHLVIAALVLPCQTSVADIISFDFVSMIGAGNDLDGLASGATASSNGGITLTMTATASTGVFNRTGTGFGIDAPAGPPNDDTDAFDDGAGIPEIMTFSVASNVPLSNLTLVSMEFDRFTAAGNDRFSIARDGVLTSGGALNDGFYRDGDLDGSNVLILNISGLSAASTLDLIHAEGAFGLENIVFDATPVPEPGHAAALASVGLLLVAQRRRKLVRKRAHEARSRELATAC